MRLATLYKCRTCIFCIKMSKNRHCHAELARQHIPGTDDSFSERASACSFARKLWIQVAAHLIGSAGRTFAICGNSSSTCHVTQCLGVQSSSKDHPRRPRGYDLNIASDVLLAPGDVQNPILFTDAVHASA